MISRTAAWHPHTSCPALWERFLCREKEMISDFRSRSSYTCTCSRFRGPLKSATCVQHSGDPPSCFWLTPRGRRSGPLCTCFAACFPPPPRVETDRNGLRNVPTLLSQDLKRFQEFSRALQAQRPQHHQKGPKSTRASLSIVFLDPCQIYFFFAF